jgi:ATP-dependent RNA helicase RhlE
MTDFEGLYLAPPILRAVAEEGYTVPTPIQARAIAPLMDGKDLMGIAQTGTGKTAAFALPLLHRLAGITQKTKKRSTRALILAPTRELANQIHSCIKTYSKYLHLKTAVAYGGVSISGQISKLHHGVDILVATPGRLLDLERQGCLRLDWVEVFILDEADRMLDMGFAPDMKTISNLIPSQRQTAMFSATMAQNVKSLAEKLLNHPLKVEVTPVATTAPKVMQRVLFVQKEKKRALLVHLLEDKSVNRVLVFTRSKFGADAVARHLEKNGVNTGIIHGNKTQSQRESAIKSFKGGRMRVLVATDVASRGIDVDGITHVINFDLPDETDNYVHRIGRTGRAGATGTALSFCDIEEKAILFDIQKAICQEVEVIDDHPFHSTEIANDLGLPVKKKRREGNNRGRRSSNGGGNSRPGKPHWKKGGSKKAA